MGQLIAIIFSIILGALATALTIVYIGSGFSDKSAEIKAQQVLQAGSQIEAAMTVYKAENAKSAYKTDLATTVTELDNLLKSTPVAPQGTYTLVAEGKEVFLVTSDAAVSTEVCDALSVMSGGTKQETGTGVYGTDLGNFRFGCVVNTGVNALVYQVE